MTPPESTAIDYTQIRYDQKEAVVTITLDRPAARNGYTVRMADELAAALDTADQDDEVRAVVLTGSGKDFCVGADLSGGGFDTTDSWQLDDPDFREPAGRCSMRMYRMRKPVIAALRGAAVGAGSSIVLSADYRLASTDSRFGFVFVRRGIVPEGASSWFLPRLVGLSTAVDWMLSGRVFDVTEALAAGLVHQVHSPEDVLVAAQALAQELSETTAPVAVALTRQMLYRMASLDSPEAVHRLDSRLTAAALVSADAHEGVTSFLQRRAPVFPGRVSTDLPEGLPWA